MLFSPRPYRFGHFGNLTPEQGAAFLGMSLPALRFRLDGGDMLPVVRFGAHWLPIDPGASVARA